MAVSMEVMLELWSLALRDGKERLRPLLYLLVLLPLWALNFCLGIMVIVFVVFAVISAGLYALVALNVRKGKNWARILTLALAMPALLAVPLGTLVAIQLISYCWLEWNDRDAFRVMHGIPATAK